MKKILAKIRQKIYRHRVQAKYLLWFKKYYPNQKTLNQQKQLFKNFKFHPKISILTPVYNPQPQHLIAAIESVINQSYPNWELCLADDASTNPEIKTIIKKYVKKDKRIKAIFRPVNGHISASSNSALTLVTGQYIGLFDHDDLLWPNALFEVVSYLREHPDTDLLYTDEDKLSFKDVHIEPAFKPDFSREMFYSTNYLCHFTVVKKDKMDQVGGFRTGVEGSQDYDLFLRLLKSGASINHLPRILYSWRQTATSTAANYKKKNYALPTSLKALSDHFSSSVATASAGLQPGTFKISYKLKSKPLVSIIIPNHNGLNFLRNCLNSILTLSTYSNFEIIIVENHSRDKALFDYYQSLSSNPKIRIIKWEKPFNFAAVNNFATDQAKGSHLLFLNNDTRILSPNWIEEMLMFSQQKDIGAVGAKLLYPNMTIQHSGVYLGVGGVANHAYYHQPDLVSQPFPVLNSKDLIRNYLAVTGACLMIAKSKFKKIGGFNTRFPIAYNDVDLCLRLHESGLRNIYTPYAKLFHYESKTINLKRDQKIFQVEQQLMKKLWPQYLKKDPFYNPHLQYFSSFS